MKNINLVWYQPIDYKRTITKKARPNINRVLTENPTNSQE